LCLQRNRVQDEFIQKAESSPKTFPIVSQGLVGIKLAATNTGTGDVAVPHHYIPMSKNKHFVGREETLEQLKRMFFFENKSQKVAVVGLGGVGKTQVALKLAYWVKESKPEHSIFWVPALSPTSFEQAYIEIAGELPIQKGSEDEDPKKSVQRYLSSKAAGPWLLVVDNADDIDMLFGSSAMPDNINQYLPESENTLNGLHHSMN
jgi:Cdc6-like AAA superfamily ATPase